MFLLIRHNGNVYRAEVNEALSIDVMKLCDLPGNTQARCWSDGQVDILAPNYQGFGAWDVDHVTPAMPEFFAESIHEGIFTNDHGEIDATLLAECVADGFDLFNRDGSLPSWLVTESAKVIAEWRQTHG